MLTIQQRVQNGIDLLDAKWPKDWRDRVNLETLDMTDCLLCVLGQTCGDYRDGRLRFELNLEDSIDNGFTGGRVHVSQEGDEFQELKTEWIRRLTEEATQ